MKNGVIIDIDKFLDLKEKPKTSNDPLIFLEKENLLNFISNCSGHKITKVNTLYLGTKLRFGNQLILISKAIFFCEILGCKRILLDKYNWFIKRKIFYNKYNMTIETANLLLSLKDRIIYDISMNWFFYYARIKPEIRIDVIKNELINNLPKIETNPKDLFIHIRSGDIFQEAKNYNGYYSQPPLCFYQKIIQIYKFSKIYIISENKLNPVIDKLILKFPKILFNENRIEIDIAYLVNAYNIVGSITTFINMIIRLNDNIKYFWEYNLQTLKSKIIHCHHSYFKPFKNITYFLMEPSKHYKIIMEKWERSNLQLETMLKEKCNNNFYIYHD